jgi:hypothetical protein
MKWIKDYSIFLESKKEYSTKTIISEICVSMILLNNDFLDNILDRGLKARYSENSEVFITDLKNLVLSKNRLNLGKYIDGRFMIDDELAKVNGIFESLSFDMEKDWKILVDARITARSIIDKLVPDRKLESTIITNIYWTSPNKNENINEDIVVELTDGKQYSIYLNKNLSTIKTASFNKLAEDLIGNDIDLLFSDKYVPHWDKMTQQWIRILYENSSKNIQSHIEKFIDYNRIDSISYFDYFDIKHSDDNYKHLGEYMKEFNRNILKFSDLLSEIWKNGDSCFSDFEEVKNKWYETKIVLLNSKILENLLTTSLKSNNLEDIKVVDDGYKQAFQKIKMKFFKNIVDKLGIIERDVFYVDNKGINVTYLPKRNFFRDNYDSFDIMFDYHVKFNIDKAEQENNDFNIRVMLNLDGEHLLDMIIVVKFSGGEMSGKLNAKYKFELAKNFNYLLSKKQWEDFI